MIRRQCQPVTGSTSLKTILCMCDSQTAICNNATLRARDGIMTVKRTDKVGIVVEDIDAAIEFLTELGLDLERRAPVEGDWADGVTGLHAMRVEIAMMRTPDCHSRLELSSFLAPPVVADHRTAPVTGNFGRKRKQSRAELREFRSARFAQPISLNVRRNNG